jgi:hypothetical protein
MIDDGLGGVEGREEKLSKRACVYGGEEEMYDGGLYDFVEERMY